MFKVRRAIQLSFSYVFIAMFGSKRNVEINECFAKLQAKRLIALCACSPCNVLLKDNELAEQLTYDEQKLFLLLLYYYADYFLTSVSTIKLTSIFLQLF